MSCSLDEKRDRSGRLDAGLSASFRHTRETAQDGLKAKSINVMQGINYEKTLIDLLYEWPTTYAGDGRASVQRIRAALVQAVVASDRSTPVARMSVPSFCLCQEPP
jgi:hypothetical protein